MITPVTFIRESPRINLAAIESESVYHFHSPPTLSSTATFLKFDQYDFFSQYKTQLIHFTELNVSHTKSLYYAVYYARFGEPAGVKNPSKNLFPWESMCRSVLRPEKSWGRILGKAM